MARGPARARVEHLDRRRPARRRSSCCRRSSPSSTRGLTISDEKCAPGVAPAGTRDDDRLLRRPSRRRQVDVRIGPGDERDRRCGDECHERSIGATVNKHQLAERQSPFAGYSRSPSRRRPPRRRHPICSPPGKSRILRRVLWPSIQIFHNGGLRIRPDGGERMTTDVAFAPAP